MASQQFWLRFLGLAVLLTLLAVRADSVLVSAHAAMQRPGADLSYGMDQARSTDQGRQHHHDENSPTGPRDPGSYRHRANVNYDYY